jgi:hypothetical protein
VIRAGLMQQCLIGNDAEPQNPTANRMIEVLLDPSNESLRAALKAQFVIPIHGCAGPRFARSLLTEFR